IPGCPGVGEKTAVKLLQQFGSIDNLLARTEELKGALKTKIEGNKELILFSRYLATIRTDVPVVFDEKALETEPRNETDLRVLFEELEFRTLTAKLGNGFSSFPPDEPIPPVVKPPKTSSHGQMSLFDEPDEPKPFPPSTKEIVDETTLQVEITLFEEENAGVPASGMKSIRNVPHKYVLVDTKVKRADLVSKLFIQKSVCFDTETTGLDMFNDELVGLSFCYLIGEAFYVPLPANRTEATEVLREFKAFFQNERIEKVGQNIKFDLLMLRQYGIELKGKLFDTMIAHYLLKPELRHGMDYLAEIMLNYRTIHYEELVGGKGKNMPHIRTVDIHKLCDYAAEDADITFRLKQILEKELVENGLTSLFYDIEMPLMKVLADMEHTGVRIDSEALRQSSVVLTNDMFILEKEIHQLAGMEFNVSSPMQVGEVLFKHLKLDEKAKRTKSGQYSTSEDVLEKIRFKHPVIQKILDYRGLKKLLSTYIDALPLLINPATGKVHTSYNQTVAVTGRLSSTNPNLQNIPIRDEQGKEIRKAFIPDDGCLFLSIDYSQIELRIMAHLSQDANMLEAFNNNLDIHSATAAKIFNIPIGEVTSDMRRKAKTANFGIIYGISAFGLADRLGIAKTEARDFIDGYFRTYPGVKRYMDESIRKAQEAGFVETMFGRKRTLPDINSQNSVVRGFAERNAINAPIQGSAADIIKIAMINIHKRLNEENIRAKMTMQVHDELNFSVPRDEIDHVRQLATHEMENAIKLNVPLIADSGVGENWLEAH
ncbi:MAG TPA: DNA polymerase I, partial [Paludibacter sp.]|nr:DNA polymerase I [Paludibacter sp.]